MIADYADAIQLNSAFTPATGPASVQSIADALLHDALLHDEQSQRFASTHPPPTEAHACRRWIRAALTLRNPGNLSQTLLSDTDRMLQAELAGKQITDAAALPRESGAYPAAPMVSLWNGDITTLRVGAVTNAANAQLLGCFQPFHTCIDNAIHNAAGPRLRDDCAKLIALQGHSEPTGGAKVTRAYNLPADFVVHTVGPIVVEHDPTPAQARELAECYVSCLSLAAAVDAKSLALCGISTGVFGYPPDQAARIALQTVADWSVQHPNALEHIVFNTFGREATKLYRDAIDTWA